MKIGVGLKPEGHFTIKKWSKKRGTCSTLTFNNLVLDVGWDNWKPRLFQSNNSPEYLYLGTGTSEPANTDAGLESISQTLGAKKVGIYGTSYVQGHSPGQHIYHQVTHEFNYDEGEAEGVWTELGLAFGDTYTEPYNRSLFRDENGDPVSLTILADEYLTVYVRLRVYWSVAQQTGTFDFNGTPVNWTANAVLSEDSFWGGRTSNANVFSRGLPKYGAYNSSPAYNPKAPAERFTNGPSSVYGVTSTTDAQALSASATLQHDPDMGDLTIYQLGWRAQDGGSNHAYSIVFIIWMDEQIVKTADERLIGSWSIQFFRDDGMLT